MRGGPLLGGPAQVKTLVRLHPTNSPKYRSARATVRAKSKVMVNIHRGHLPVPPRDMARHDSDSMFESAYR
jgi:hypothetical protein